ncbi:GIY-YIG nuclease family protein [Gramella sp. BOM4]|nr:GIY-YIG nuclease family protein [Christiangramia bathymodioli]
MKSYYLYITTNYLKTVLYVGITNDLNKRIDQHYQDSKLNKKSFAGKYNCYHLVYFEEFQNPSEAILREKKVKLIEDFNSEWRFLENQF